jgi:hypothetical protein
MLGRTTTYFYCGLQNPAGLAMIWRTSSFPREPKFIRHSRAGGNPFVNPACAIMTALVRNINVSPFMIRQTCPELDKGSLRTAQLKS